MRNRAIKQGRPVGKIRLMWFAKKGDALRAVEAERERERHRAGRSVKGQQTVGIIGPERGRPISHFSTARWALFLVLPGFIASILGNSTVPRIGSPYIGNRTRIGAGASMGGEACVFVCVESVFRGPE